MVYYPTENISRLATEDYLIITAYVVIFIIGVIGNGTVCYIFKAKYNRLSSVQTLIYYLAIIDILSSIINPALFIYWQATFYKQWHFGNFGCKVLPSMTRLTIDVSLSVTLLISIDRCRKLCQPFKDNLSKNTIRLIIVLCFVISLICETPEMIYQQVDSRSTCEVHSVNVTGYAYPRVVSHGIKDSIFLLVFVVANYFSYKELYKKRTREILQSKHQLKEKRRNFKTIITMSIVFMVAVFPRDMFFIVYTSSWMHPPGISLTKPLLDLNSCLKILQTSNSICNIFIYARLHAQFRRRIFRHVRDLTAKLLTEVCKDVSREPKLVNKTNDDDEDLRADISARGVWQPLQRAFFDVKVFHPLAQSYRNQSLEATFRSMENQKKRKYNTKIQDKEHGTCCVLCYTTRESLLAVYGKRYRKTCK